MFAHRLKKVINSKVAVIKLKEIKSVSFGCIFDFLSVYKNMET